MSQSQPRDREPAGGGDSYTAMVASMERHQSYVGDRARAMAGQHAAYEEGRAAEAALRAAKASMAVVVSRAGLAATPAAAAWDMVHYRGMSVRAAASKLGVKQPALLELLADYRAVAEEQELRMLRASDAAHMYGGKALGL